MKQFTMTTLRMEDIQQNPDKYLPIAMYSIGCHVQHMERKAVEGLIAALQYELRERDYFEVNH